jgi:hypothetical protein
MIVMHILASNLTAVMLAAHALLGCCWHHGHGSEQMSGPVAITARISPQPSLISVQCATACSQAMYGEDPHVSTACEQAVAQHNCGTQHGERPDCQDGPCLFIGPTTQNISPSAAYALQPLVATLPPANLFASSAAIERSLLATEALLPPVRLHLAHQVLLL